MNAIKAFWVVALAVLTGCVSSTSYKEWSGPNEFTGEGGTVRRVKDVDIWENGEPARKFRILGIIDNTVVGDAGAMVLSSGYPDKRIVNETKKHGGDGVILLSSDTTAQRANNGVVIATTRKVVVIKYVDDDLKSSRPNEATKQALLALMQESDEKVAGSNALRPLLKAANQGDATAQITLALFYILRPDENFEEAFKWVITAAHRGSPGAQFMLALLHQDTDGGSLLHERNSGMEWSDEGEDALKRFLLHSTFVRKNPEKAAVWHSRAAHAGFAPAQYELGRLYNEGKGTTKDYVEAYKWLNLAAAKGVEDAGTLRDELAAKMTPEQIAQGQERASNFTPGSPPAMK